MNKKKIMIAMVILIVLCIAISLILYNKYEKDKKIENSKDIMK